MQRAFCRFAAGLAGLLCLGVFPALAPAQSIWLTPPREPVFSLEALKPSFKGANNLTWTTSVFFLSFRVPASEKALFVAEVPFVHSGLKSNAFGSGSTSNLLGNPYIGFELGKTGHPVFGELGVRLPLAKGFGGGGFADGVGLYTDFDRFEAFFIEVASITGMLNYRHKAPSGVAVRLRGGPIYTFSTGQNPDSETYLGYSAQVWHESRRVHVGGGLTGRMVLSGGPGSLGERTIHQLGVFANFPAGKVQPGVHIRLPLDEELSNDLNLVFGVNLGITLR
jgi:hypothetical protein